MEKRRLSSNQIEYHKDTNTWVPKNEILTGLIDCQPDGWGFVGTLGIRNLLLAPLPPY